MEKVRRNCFIANVSYIIKKHMHMLLFLYIGDKRWHDEFHLSSTILYMNSVVGKSEFYFRLKYFYFGLLFILFACMSALFNSFFLPMVFLITCHYNPILVLLLAYEGCTTIIINHLMAM